MRTQDTVFSENSTQSYVEKEKKGRIQGAKGGCRTSTEKISPLCEKECPLPGQTEEDVSSLGEKGQQNHKRDIVAQEERGGADRLGLIGKGGRVVGNKHHTESRALRRTNVQGVWESAHTAGKSCRI